MSGLNQLMADVRFTESSDNYSAINGSFHGAYQFGLSAFIDTGYITSDSTSLANATWTGKNGIQGLDDWYDDTEAQDSAFIEWVQVLWRYIRVSDQEPYGEQTLNDHELTISGMIMASHLVGTGSFRNGFVANGGTTDPVDGNGVAASDYLREFGGYDVTDTTGVNPNIIPEGFEEFFVTNTEKNNELRGGTGNDVLRAFEGNDLVFGTSGSDSLDGGEQDRGPGNADILTYEELETGVSIKVAALGAGGNQTVLEITDLANPGSWTDNAIDFEIVGLTNADDMISITPELLNVLETDGIIINGLGGLNTIDGASLDSGVLYRYASGTITVEGLSDGSLSSSSTGNGIRIDNFGMIMGSLFDDQFVTNGGRLEVEAGGGDDTFTVSGIGIGIFDGGEDSSNQDTDKLIFDFVTDGLYLTNVDSGGEEVLVAQELFVGSDNGYVIQNIETITLSDGIDLFSLSNVPTQDDLIVNARDGEDYLYADGVDVSGLTEGPIFVLEDDADSEPMEGYMEFDGQRTGINGFEVLVATTANDTIQGSSVRNVLEGIDGDDTIIGMDGLDDVVGGDGNDILIGGRDFREIEPTTADYASDDTDFLYGGAGFDTYHAVRNDQVFDSDFAPDGQTYGDGEVFYEGLLLTGGSEVPLGTAPFLSIPQLGLEPESFKYYEGASGEFYCIADTTYTFQGVTRPTTLCVVLKDDPLNPNSLFIFDFDTAADSYLGISLTDTPVSAATPSMVSGLISSSVTSIISNDDSFIFNDDTPEVIELEISKRPDNTIDVVDQGPSFDTDRFDLYEDQLLAPDVDQFIIG